MFGRQGVRRMSRTPDPEPRIPEPGPRLLHVLHRPLGEQFLEPEALDLGSEGRPGASENGRYVNSARQTPLMKARRGAS